MQYKLLEVVLIVVFSILAPFVRLWKNWAQKQQQIYEHYQAAAPTREVLVRYRLAVEQSKTDLAYKIWLGKKELKAGLK